MPSICGVTLMVSTLGVLDPPSPSETRKASVRLALGLEEVSPALSLRSGEAVVLILRLLEAVGVPTVLDEIWLPGVRFRGLSAERLDAWHGPLYALFETEFGTRMIRAAERLKAVAADRARARTLQVAEGAPLLLVERVSRTYGEQPGELRRGYCVTERHHSFNELA